jgi:ADP-heptose:LPS heptosyltransferase
VAGRAWLYTTQVARPRTLRPRHSVDNQWDLLDPLGIPRPTPETHPTELRTDAAAALAVDEWLSQTGIASDQRLVIVHVGARIHFRRWPPDRFASAIAALARADPRTRFAVVAGPGEDTANRVVEMARDQLPEPTRAAVLDARGWTLDELHALAGRAAFMSAATRVRFTSPAPRGPDRRPLWADPARNLEALAPGRPGHHSASGSRAPVPAVRPARM